MKSFVCFVVLLSTLMSVPTTRAAQSENETRVYLRRQCLVSEPSVKATAQPQFLNILASIFIPILIEKGIGAVSAALRKAGTGSTLHDTGKVSSYLYNAKKGEKAVSLSVSPEMGCVIVVRGTFNGPDEQDDYAQTEVDFGAEANHGVLDQPEQEQKRIDRLNLSKIPVESIAILYEAQIRISDDKRAMSYENRYLQVNEFISGKGGSRALVVSLELQDIDTKGGDADVLSLALMNLGDVTRGTILGSNRIPQKNSGWLGGLGMSADALTAIGKMDFSSATSKEIQGAMPVTLVATITETSKNRDALIFIADVLDAGKKQVAEKVSADILDKKAEKDKIAADLATMKTSEEAAYRAYLQAYIALTANCPASAGNPTPAQILLIFERDQKYTEWKTKYDELTRLGFVAENRKPEKLKCPNE